MYYDEVCVCVMKILNSRIQRISLFLKRLFFVRLKRKIAEFFLEYLFNFFGNSIVYRNHKVCDGFASLYDGSPSYIEL